MKTNSNNHVTRETRAMFGMNRNDFYEYKKQRCMELAQKGATVGEIAKDLGMTEKEMYAFLSRNFGGVKRMREFANTPNGIPQVQMAAMSVPTDIASNSEDENKQSLLAIFGTVLSNEKSKLLSDFKENVDEDIKSVISEIELALSELKAELIMNFKNSLLSDLSELAKSL